MINLPSTSLVIADLLSRNLCEVFDELDHDRRRAAIEALFVSDCIFIDPRGRHFGHIALEEAIVSLQAETEGYRFRQIGVVECLRDAGRVNWAYGPPNDPERITGTDFAISIEGRITILCAFLNHSYETTPEPGNENKERCCDR